MSAESPGESAVNQEATVLIMFVRIPGADRTMDADIVARELAEMVNEERRENGWAGDISVEFATWSQYERRHFPPVDGCQCPACEAQHG